MFMNYEKDRLSTTELRQLHALLVRYGKTDCPMLAASVCVEMRRTVADDVLAREGRD